MLKVSTIVIVAATAVAACEAQPEARVGASGWHYSHAEDKLRQASVVAARLESTEKFSDDPNDEPRMVMTITKGSADDDGVLLVSNVLICSPYDTLIRVDAHPLEGLPCPASGQFVVRLAPDTDLAKNITASKEVVIETPSGLYTEQVTFDTEGLDLSQTAS